jgi:flagellar biosynthesis GTPase FlhF
MYNPRLSVKEVELFETLRLKKLRDAETFADEEYPGILDNLIGHYSESAHFVYELLQNADDCEASSVEFLLFPQFLIFKHNGPIQFSITEKGVRPIGHINAITNIGFNEKKDNKIGKFGIGFKSVLKYSSSPEIYDDKFWFKLDFIVPTLLEHDNEYRQHGETLFKLPFIQGKEQEFYDVVRDRLSNLDNPLLFLKHLSCIKWTCYNDEGGIIDTNSYSKEIIEEQAYSGCLFQRIIVNNSGNEKSLLFFTQDIVIGERVFDINVGYYIDKETNKLNFEDSGSLYCYFPTKENLRTCFISHGPFQLTDSRETLKHDPNESRSHNEYIIKRIAQLAANALPIIRDYGISTGVTLIDDNILQIFPFDFSEWDVRSNPIKSREYIIRNEFKRVFEAESLFLCNDSQTYINATRAYTCTPVTILDYFSSEQLNLLIGTQNGINFKFLSKGICRKQELKECLSKTFNIKDLKSEAIALRITEDFMAKQPFDWTFRLYQFMIAEAPKLWKTDQTTKNKLLPFKYAPIILTKSNKWVRPYIDENNHNVHLDIGSGSNDDSYNYVSQMILDNPIGQRLIREMGISEPDRLSYITSCILPKYSQEIVEIEDDDCVIHLKALFEQYRSLPVNERDSYIHLIKDAFYVLGSDNILHKPHEVYIYSNELNKYFRNTEWIYCDEKFYGELFGKYPSNEIRDFLYAIGCHRIPRLINQNFNDNPIEKSRRFHNMNIHRWSSAEVYNYSIEGCKTLIESEDYSKEDSIYIWNIIDRYYLEQISNFVVKYKKRYDGYPYEEKSASDFISYLKSVRWLFKESGTKCSVSDFNIEDINIVGYQYSQKMINAFDIRYIHSSLEGIKGVTQDQIENERKGRLIRQYNEDEILEMTAWFEKKRKSQKKAAEAATSSSQQNTLPDRPAINVVGIENMFTSSTSHASTTHHENDIKIDETATRSLEQRMTDIEDEVRRKQEIESTREAVCELEKYSFEWFNTLLSLEFNDTSSEDGTEIRRALSIDFSTVSPDPNSERVLILSNPSRFIPLWIEEMGNIEVKFYFKDQEDISLGFEVSNVREFRLYLKAKECDKISIQKIDWRNCIKASINRNNPIELIGKLQNAFKSLGFADTFNMKEHLPKNIHFLFGPPGTGKTTNLAKRIVQKMTDPTSDCKILVLAPTNKACDVLCRKILHEYKYCSDWLSRFVATGDEIVESSGLVTDRDSTIYFRNKCCVVSTIARLPYDGFRYGALKDLKWDYIIFDEASMISLAYITYALYKFKQCDFLVAGDPFQISPIVHEKIWENENIYTMVNLNSFSEPHTEPHQFTIENLDTQYRSIPSIGELFSRYSYDGLLKHNRTEDSQNRIEIKGIPLSSINFFTFNVDFYNSIFSPKKLSGSNVHIYSVIFTLEFCKYIIKHLEEKDGVFKIGIIRPYAAQAQLIEKMIEQVALPEHVRISVGTIHSFQGDECNMILAVFNPPRMANENALINVKNIINVAISRAEDYLCILLPHSSTRGFNNYVELNSMGISAMSISKEKGHVSEFTCDGLEETILGKMFSIENNTFVTAHQMANVYGVASKRFEVRIDDKAADIQINDFINYE